MPSGHRAGALERAYTSTPKARRLLLGHLVGGSEAGDPRRGKLGLLCAKHYTEQVSFNMLIFLKGKKNHC